MLNTKVSKANINRSSPRVSLDRVLESLTEPDIELLSRKPDIGLLSRKPDIGLLSRKPDIGLLSKEPGIGLLSRRANDLQNLKEIQTTDDNLKNKPSQIYAHFKLPGLKAPGLQIRSMDIPRKKNVQLGGLFIAPNAANEQQERIKMQGGPNRSIRPDKRLTKKKTIHLMPGIRGDISSLQNQHHSQPVLTDLQTVPYSRLLPQNSQQSMSGTRNYGNFPFEISLLQFQHASHQDTRRIRVKSSPEMEKKQFHVHAGLANKISSNNLTPNGYAYEYSGQPHAVIINISTMKNLSNVCAPGERFTCNPVENVAVSKLHSWCISNCNQRLCPVVKCSCICISLATHDVRNIIAESNEVVPFKQTNFLGQISQNSITGTPKLPKTVNIIGMNAESLETGSPMPSKIVNINGVNAEISGTGSPMPSKTVNIIGMNAAISGTGFPMPLKTVNIIGRNVKISGTRTPTPSKPVNIIGMNAENSATGFPPAPKTVNMIGMNAKISETGSPMSSITVNINGRNAEISGTGSPTPSKTVNIIGMNGSDLLPQDVVQKPRVTCTVKNLFSSSKGMIDWCNTECNIKLSECPMHICDCQFVL